MMPPRARVLVIAAVSTLAGCSRSGPAAAPAEQQGGDGAVDQAITSGPRITHGVTLGEVTSESLVAWARADRPARVHLALTPDADVAGPAPVHVSASASAERDHTGRVLVEGLAPDTRYRYAIWVTAPDAPDDPAPPASAWRGFVRTAPARDTAAAVTFAWGGDLAGQDVCRDGTRGFAIMEHLGAEELDFFIALGDMIYADNPCTERGMYGNVQVPGLAIATSIQGFWSHWRYAREDARFADFLARVPMYPVWDDHEVVNDVGPAHDTRSSAPYTPGAHLLPTGLRAFLDYNPLAHDPTGPVRLYRSVRWGQHLELFFLDTRQYRDANSAVDTDDAPKTMLGAEQRAWLERSLTTSDATWKVVVSSVPLSIPTGSPPENGRDGWAGFDQETGFERELLGMLRTFQAAGQDRTLWLTTDVHFAAGFRYQPFPEHPSFQVHEWISGPLNAGLFPQNGYDETLRPTRLFHFGPANARDLDYEQARGWMNYGRVTIDRDGRLTVDIVDGRGQTVHRETLEP